MTTIEDIRERLSEIRPPGAPSSIIELNLIRGLRFEAGRVSVDFQPPALPQGMVEALVADIRRAVGALQGVSEVEVRLVSGQGDGTFADVGVLPGVTDIVAVASTKGGVGKSTVAVNIACALSRLDQRVGLLDADVYGPSLPTMVGLAERPQVKETRKIVPLTKYGLKLMSMGFFLDEDTPVLWRGPLVSGLLRQFLTDVEWGELDVLVIDLPPGTGDAQLTLVQHVPLSGGVIVTTPQQVSLADVERGVAMFQRVNTPVLGVVENMSGYVCPNCGHEEALFGSGGGARIAADFGIPLLGQIPLVPEVRIGGDAGKPIVVERPDSPVSRIFVSVAQSVLDLLDIMRQQAPTPKIVG
jgi:ATP-binding protein involved in chromosome partitioning